MKISKPTFGQIIIASACSTSPMSDEALHELAGLHGDDPDALIAQHREYRDNWKRKKTERDKPMPMA